jgi:carbon monoxide dehydrogenase subunit G
MKVELEKTFPVQGSADVAWAFLQDIEAVAACMPGAKITERLPTGGYKGTVTVRVGPATMSFRGELDVRDIDEATRSLQLLGKGTDSTGSSGASMTLAARIEAAADGASSLVGKSEVTMSGKAAAFGGRMMNSVADQILKQFADNFTNQVAARAAAAAPPPAEPPGAAPPAAGTSDEAGSPPAPSVAVPSAAASPDAARSPAPPPVARELNALSLLWAVFRDWLRGLFRRSPS